MFIALLFSMTTMGIVAGIGYNLTVPNISTRGEIPRLSLTLCSRVWMWGEFWNALWVIPSACAAGLNSPPWRLRAEATRYTIRSPAAAVPRADRPAERVSDKPAPGRFRSVKHAYHRRCAPCIPSYHRIPQLLSPYLLAFCSEMATTGIVAGFGYNLTEPNIYVYEWKRTGKTKQPYYFKLADETQFAFAGIWDEWRKDGVSLASCSIITTTPNDLLAAIHDRMPVILTPEGQDAWLHSDTRIVELRKLLVPFPAHAMKDHPVSQKVNHAQAEDAQLVEPIDLSHEVTNLTLF